MTKVQHQWTSEQHGKERTTKEKVRKDMTRVKENHLVKEKALATTTTTTKEKANTTVPSDKAIL